MPQTDTTLLHSADLVDDIRKRNDHVRASNDRVAATLCRRIGRIDPTMVIVERNVPIRNPDPARTGPFGQPRSGVVYRVKTSCVAAIHEMVRNYAESRL